jgi:hypothetical protein
MKTLAYLILCLVPLAMASGGQSAQPELGKVTLVYFWASLVRPLPNALACPATHGRYRS